MMKTYTTSQRLKQIMEERNLRQIDIVNAAQPFCKRYGVRLGKNTMSQYVSGKTEPGDEKLTILGLALNVSEVWLMGYDVPMQRETPAPDTIQDERKGRLINLFDCLSPSEQDEIISMIEWKLSRR